MEVIPLHHRATVLTNTLLCDEHYLLTLRHGGIANITEPGQFVQLRVNRSADLLLRRPFSIARVRPDQEQFDIVYRVVGKGTRVMVDLKPGEGVDLIGPLGQGFHLPKTRSTCLLVGGGVGVAPLWGLAEKLSQQQHPTIALLGFRSIRFRFGEDVFKTLKTEIVVTTDDGSYGTKGLASDHLQTLLKRQIDQIYLCGPPAMLRVAIPMAREAGIKGEVSLEEHMGCGFGVCLSCVAKVWRDGTVERVRVCFEGPVFPVEDVVLDDET